MLIGNSGVYADICTKSKGSSGAEKSEGSVNGAHLICIQLLHSVHPLFP